MPSCQPFDQDHQTNRTSVLGGPPPLIRMDTPSFDDFGSIVSPSQLCITVSQPLQYTFSNTNHRHVYHQLSSMQPQHSEQVILPVMLSPGGASVTTVQNDSTIEQNFVHSPQVFDQCMISATGAAYSLSQSMQTSSDMTETTSFIGDKSYSDNHLAQIPCCAEYIMASCSGYTAPTYSSSLPLLQTVTHAQSPPPPSKRIHLEYSEVCSTLAQGTHSTSDMVHYLGNPQHTEFLECRGAYNHFNTQMTLTPNVGYYITDQYVEQNSQSSHSQLLSTLPTISVQSFDLVYNTLYSVRSKWYEFGLALGLLTDTLDSIAIDESHKTEGCLRKMLCKRMEMNRLTWDEVVAALRRPSVSRNDLAEKIEKGDLNYLNKAGAVYDLSGEPTLKELCALPVENVWYQLGLWLGIEEGVLEKLKKNQSVDKLEEIFSAFLDLPLGKAQYEDLVEELSNKQYRKAEAFLKQHDYDEFVDLFPIEKKATAQEIVDERKAPKYPRLVMALVKVGQRKIAEQVCSKKGMSIT